jgi:hypothetical protein
LPRGFAPVPPLRNAGGAEVTSALGNAREWCARKQTSYPKLRATLGEPEAALLLGEIQREKAMVL